MRIPYKWKLKAPKDGESTSKMVLSDGKRKKYHWCEYQNYGLSTHPRSVRSNQQGRTRERRLSIRRPLSMEKRRRST